MKRLVAGFLSASVIFSFFNLDVLATNDDEQNADVETSISETIESEEPNSEPVDIIEDDSEEITEEIPDETTTTDDSAIEGTEPSVTDEIITDDSVEEETDEEETSETVLPEQSASWDGTTKEMVFENDLIHATFTLDNTWSGGYTATVTIENISDKKIENWCFYWKYDGSISNIWNAKILEEHEDGYLIKNADWNKDILPGQKVSFGLNGSSDFTSFPNDYRLIGKIGSVNEENYSIDYTLYSDWEDGFNADIKINNTTDENIDDWVLEFDFSRDITEIWNAEILSHEGDHYVIKNLGYNSLLYANSSVQFGFNGINGDSDSVPTNYKLSSFKPEEEIVITDESYVAPVYGNLEVIYQEGDLQYNVKHNVILPTDFEEVTVTWSSSNPDIIANDGTVHRPYSESALVTLTATVSYNEFSLEKEFELRVIKTMYDDYSLDNIFVLDEIDQIYFYNDIIEDLQIFENDLGYVECVIGSISDLIIDSPDEAMMAIYGIQRIMGTDTIYDELEVNNVFKDSYGYFFTFTQVYQGVPVYGSYVTLTTDLEGNVTGFSSNYVPVNANISNACTSDAAISAISDIESVISSKLYIYNETTAVPAWEIIYVNSNGDSRTALINAIDLSVISNTFSARNVGGDTSIDKGVGEDGEKHDLNVCFATQEEIDEDLGDDYVYDDGDTVYILKDVYRHIIVYEMAPYAFGYTINNVASRNLTQSTSWNPESVSAYANVATCSDYYSDRYNIRSFDQFNPSRMKYVFVGMNYDNAMFTELINLRDPSGETYTSLGFGEATSSYKGYGSDLSTVGHEYTHGVIFGYTALDKGYDINESGPINEGYADVMGFIISGDTSWIVYKRNGDIERNCADPKSFSDCAYDYSMIKGFDYQNSSNPNYYTHMNSTILSHACYEMYINGFGYDLLSDLVVRSIRIGYGSDSTFVDVRRNFEQAAVAMGLNEYQKQIIRDAFDDVNVKLDNLHTIKDKSFISGKVVEGAPHRTINQASPLSGVKISLHRKNNAAEYGTPVYTDESGLYTFLDIAYGKYTIEFSKDGYVTGRKEIEFKNKETYLDIVQLLKIEYAGVGSVSGRVIDSATGKGVAGLSIDVIPGLDIIWSNSKPVKETITTDENGYYHLNDYYSGYYTLYVHDRRTDVEAGKKYAVAIKSVLVFGNNTCGGGDYNIVVSNTPFGALRIVLEWGAQPNDLDSHLVYDSNGTDIYYRHKTLYEDGKLTIRLDLDDVDGFGPETTTIYDKTHDCYIFYVYEFSRTGTMSKSNARVSVYFGMAYLPSYVFYVPNNSTALYWTVFAYYPKTNKLVPLNLMGNSWVRPTEG